MIPATAGFAKSTARQHARKPSPAVDVDLQAVCSRCRQPARGNHICVYKLTLVVSR